MKRREKSAELLQKNHEKKAEQLNQLIQRINKKHEDNRKRMEEYYKEMEIKAEKYKLKNTKKRNIQENLLKSMEARRQRRIKEYFRK